MLKKNRRELENFLFENYVYLIEFFATIHRKNPYGRIKKINIKPLKPEDIIKRKIKAIDYDIKAKESADKAEESLSKGKNTISAQKEMMKVLTNSARSQKEKQLTTTGIKIGKEVKDIPKRRFEDIIGVKKYELNIRSI